MDREIGNKFFPLWLLGDSNPERWQKRLTSPFDPRHPIRHNIWTSVLDVIQDKVYREKRLRVNTEEIYIRNAVADPNIKPPGTALIWEERLGNEITILRSPINENRPRLILAFGAFSFEFCRRVLDEQPNLYFNSWGAKQLGNEFRARITKFHPKNVNLLPLLHRSVAGGYFLSAHRDFCNEEGANYFVHVGENIAEQLLKYRNELSVWIN